MPELTDLILNFKAQGGAQAVGELKAVDAGIKETERSAGLAGKAFSGMFIGAAAAVGGVAVIATGLFKIGDAYDAMSDHIAVATGKQGAALKALDNDAMTVFKQIPTTMGIAGDAIASISAKTGDTGKNLISLTESEIELARVTGTDLNSNITESTKLFESWNVAAKDQTSTLDGLFNASQKYGVGVDTLMGQVEQFTPQIKAMGLSLDQGADFIGKIDHAGGHVTTVMRGITKETNSLAKSGVDVKAGMTDVYDSINNAGSAAEAQAIAVKDFGSKAGPELAQMIRSGTLSVDDFTGAVDSTGKSILATAKSTYDFSENWDLFKNNVEAALVPLGSFVFQGANKVIPLLTKGIGELSRFGHAFSIVSKDVKVFGNAMKAAFDTGYKVRQLVDFMPRSLQPLERGFLLVADSIGDVVRGFQQGGLSQALSDLPHAIGQTLDGIASLAGGLGDIAKNAAGGVINFVISGAISLAGDIKDAAGDLVGWIKKKVHNGDWGTLALAAAPITLAPLAIYGAIKLGGDLLDVNGDIWTWVRSKLYGSGKGGDPSLAGLPVDDPALSNITISDIVVDGAIKLGDKLEEAKGDLMGWVRRQLLGVTGPGGQGPDGPQLPGDIAAAWNASIPLGDLTVNAGLVLEKGIFGAANSLWGWFKNEIGVGHTSGGSLSDLGATEAAGDTGGTAVTLGDVAVNVGRWLIHAGESVWDALKTFGSGAAKLGKQVAVPLGDVAVNVGKWLVSAGESVWDAVTRFGSGAAKLGKAAGVELKDVAVDIASWGEVTAQDIWGWIQGKLGVGSGATGTFPGLSTAAGTGGLTLTDVAVNIASLVPTLAADVWGAAGDFGNWMKAQVLAGWNGTVDIGSFDVDGDPNVTGGKKNKSIGEKIRDAVAGSISAVGDFGSVVANAMWNVVTNYEWAQTINDKSFETGSDITTAVHDAFVGVIKAGVGKLTSVDFGQALNITKVIGEAIVVDALFPQAAVNRIQGAVSSFITGSISGLVLGDTDLSDIGSNITSQISDAIFGTSATSTFPGLSTEAGSGATSGIVGAIAKFFTDLPGEIASAVGTLADIDIDHPGLPGWMTNWDWITGPIATLKGYIADLIGTKIQADSVTGDTPGPGSAGYTGPARDTIPGDWTPTLSGGDAGGGMPQPKPAGSVGVQHLKSVIDPPDIGKFVQGVGNSLKSYKATLDFDTGPAAIAYTDVSTWGAAWAKEKFAATFDADTGPAAVAYTDVSGWGATWAGETFQATFGIDNGPAAIAYTDAYGWGDTWGNAVFTARFSIDTSGLAVAEAAALSAVAFIDSIMPHSPAKHGPLKRLPRWGALFEGIGPAGDKAVNIVSGHAALIAGAFGASVQARAMGGGGGAPVIINHYNLNGVNGDGAIKEVNRMVRKGVGTQIRNRSASRAYSGAKLP